MKRIVSGFVLIAICTAILPADSDDITFYMPSYTPEALSFFLSEYQNALANSKKSNWYLTAFWNPTFNLEEPVYERDDGTEATMPPRTQLMMNRLAVSTGFILPLKLNAEGDSFSFIGHLSIVADAVEEVAEAFSSFVGGGVRLDVGMVSVGFLLGDYLSTYKADFVYDGSSWRPQTGSWRAQTKEERNVTKFALPLRLALSEQIIFLDKLVANFAFGNSFDLAQVFTKLMFTTLNIGATQLGLNVYYKNEDYSVIARQQVIGVSFNTKYLQFDGGYRFFNMKRNSEWLNYNDGPYGRLLLKKSYSLFGLVEGATIFSIAVEKKADYEFIFGLGLTIGGNIYHSLLELGTNGTGIGSMGYVQHVNLRANSQ